jgi:hypothetical protein
MLVGGGREQNVGTEERRHRTPGFPEEATQNGGTACVLADLGDY